MAGSADFRVLQTIWKWPVYCDFHSIRVTFIYASNEPKPMLAWGLGDCRDNHKKLAKRVSYDFKTRSHILIRNSFLFTDILPVFRSDFHASDRSFRQSVRQRHLHRLWSEGYSSDIMPLVSPGYRIQSDKSAMSDHTRAVYAPAGTSWQDAHVISVPEY